jgi:putative transposase
LAVAEAGSSLANVRCELNYSKLSFYRWKAKLGRMRVSEAKRLRELECENTQLKKIVTDNALDNRVSMDVNSPKCRALPEPRRIPSQSARRERTPHLSD